MVSYSYLPETALLAKSAKTPKGWKMRTIKKKATNRSHHLRQSRKEGDQRVAGKGGDSKDYCFKGSSNIITKTILTRSHFPRSDNLTLIYAKDVYDAITPE